MIVRGLTLGLVLTSVLFISGCSQINSSSPPVVVTPELQASQQQAWQQRQAFLAKKPSWRLNSKVSLRIEDENLIFGLNWMQLPTDNYVIRINNPITGGLISKLSRTNSVVTLLAGNGRTFQDTDEERLLHSQTGLRIPVKGLRFWVRGLSSPQNKLDKLVLDGAGRPISMQQGGWNIVYSSYVNNGTNALPRKINLSRGVDNISIRLIVKKWQ